MVSGLRLLALWLRLRLAIADMARPMATVALRYQRLRFALLRLVQQLYYPGTGIYVYDLPIAGRDLWTNAQREHIRRRSASGFYGAATVSNAWPANRPRETQLFAQRASSAAIKRRPRRLATTGLKRAASGRSMNADSAPLSRDRPRPQFETKRWSPASGPPPHQHDRRVTHDRFAMLVGDDRLRSGTIRFRVWSAMGFCRRSCRERAACRRDRPAWSSAIRRSRASRARPVPRSTT